MNRSSYFGRLLFWSVPVTTSLYLFSTLSFSKAVFAVLLNIVGWVIWMVFLGRRSFNRITRDVIHQFLTEWQVIGSQIKENPAETIQLFSERHWALTEMVSRMIVKEITLRSEKRNLRLTDSDLTMLRTHFEAIFSIIAIKAYGMVLGPSTFRDLSRSYFLAYLTKGHNSAGSVIPSDIEREQVFNYFHSRGYRTFEWASQNQPDFLKTIRQELSELVDQHIPLFLHATIGFNYRGRTTFLSAQARLKAQEIIESAEKEKKIQIHP